MSAPVTKQHLKLIDEIRVGDRSMRFDIIDAQAAQIIADSEAKAVAAVNASLDAAIIRAWGISAERDQLRAECNNLRADLDAIKAIRDEEMARAERAEAILGKLQELHGCSQEMIVHWCEHAAQRSCGLDQMKAELAIERARLDWLECHGWITGDPCDRAAIDAAMKEVA